MDVSSDQKIQKKQSFILHISVISCALYKYVSEYFLTLETVQMIKATTMQVDSDRYQIAMQWNQKYNWPFLHSKPDFLVKVHMVVCLSNVHI